VAVRQGELALHDKQQRLSRGTITAQRRFSARLAIWPVYAVVGRFGGSTVQPLDTPSNSLTLVRCVSTLNERATHSIVESWTGLDRGLHALQRVRGFSLSGARSWADADKARIHRTYLSEVERGTRNLSLINIERLAGALSMPISELFQLVERS
jgi:hypothetical protein